MIKCNICSYNALGHQDPQEFEDLIYQQQCVNCLSDQPVSKLRAHMLLCEGCMKALSPAQDQRLWSVVNSNVPQMCQAKWPNGRPCWGETRQGKEKCRNNPDCPAHPKNTAKRSALRRQ